MFKKPINKYDKKFKKISRDVCNKLKISEYIDTFGEFQPITYTDKEKNLFVTSHYFSNKTTRRTIVNTLVATNYKREDKAWVEQVVISFINEVINLYTYANDDELISKREKEISKRYNVPINRLKTQVALFLLNVQKGTDNFRILEYFSPYELVKWKYRDIMKLQNDVNQYKLSSTDRQLLIDLNYIES